MSQKIYLTILKTGIYLSLICVFFVFRNLLFPFITSKQIPFNILIEVLFIFWVSFMVKYPEYRPKKSYISFGLLAYFAALLLSCLVTVDLNLSFWGDIERMLGIFHLLHFLALYFMIITVFRTEKDWKAFFSLSVICAVLISFIGISGKADSRIGNTAYVSAYLLFNMYFALFLFFREKNRELRWIYLIAVPIMFLAFDKANTTGAYVGLGASIAAMAFLYTIFSSHKKFKLAALAVFVILIIGSGFVLMNRDSKIVKEMPFLSSLREVDFQKNTFQTRLISWRAAFRDFKTHPVLGTGHGNYAIIFDKYFEPDFYDFTRSETYFDRAHNNLIDILSTTGLVGLLTYLSIFAAVAFYLFSGYFKKKINLHEFVILSCLFVAYFVQNLAVFDAFVTYAALMAVFAYVYWFSEKDDNVIEETRGLGRKAVNYLTKDRKMENKEVYILLIVGIIFLTIAYQYNIKPLKMLKWTIDGQVAYSQNDIEKAVETYKKALSMDTVLDRDSRMSLIRSVALNPGLLQNVSEEKRNEILDYMIGLADRNVAYNPQDSMNQMVLANILDLAAGYNRDNPEKREYYSNRALEAIDKSIEASPKRIPIFFQKAQILANRGEVQKAIETMEYAVNLNENYYDSYCYLARAYVGVDDEKSFENYNHCLDKGGVRLLDTNLIKYLINHYATIDDKERMLILFEELVKKEPNLVENWVKLSKLYKDLGDIYNAEKAVRKAAEINPEITEVQIEKFLNE